VFKVVLEILLNQDWFGGLGCSS